MSSLDRVLSRVLRRAEPQPEQKSHLLALSKNLLSLVQQECQRSRLGAEATLQGSVAKDTWIPSKEEIDIFVSFNQAVTRERMEKSIIRMGKSVVRAAGGKPVLRYAEHPFVEGRVNDILVNIVACYRVPRGSWMTAADRTPHHTQYIIEKMNDQIKKETRLLKSFLVGTGIYGAEIRVGGFSGYLSELLAIRYKSFKSTIKAAARWKPPTVIDIEALLKPKTEAVERFPDASLIVVDPVDPNRNVAAAVTPEKFSEMIMASQTLLEKPRIAIFFPPQRRKPVTSQLLKRVRREQRNLLAFVLEDNREVSPDVLWGELKRTIKGIHRLLDLKGYGAIRSQPWSNSTTHVLLFELESLHLPRVYRHPGPPIYVPDAKKFLQKHLASTSTLSGPWVEGYRLQVARRRERTRASDIIRQALKEGQVSVSKSLTTALKRCQILEGETVLGLCERLPGFSGFLFDFLGGRAPFLKRSAIDRS